MNDDQVTTTFHISIGRAARRRRNSTVARVERRHFFRVRTQAFSFGRPEFKFGGRLLHALGARLQLRGPPGRDPYTMQAHRRVCICIDFDISSCMDEMSRVCYREARRTLLANARLSLCFLPSSLAWFCRCELPPFPAR